MMELEAGVLQEALNVPDEIWVLVATHLTIHGIKALESTCRHLLTLLSTSVLLWRNVMSDLLVMSPNIMYSRTLEHDSATVLRDRALRFWNIDRTLSRNDPDPIQSVTKLALPIPAIPDTATIVPGTHHVVYISYHGSVHLVSLLTGEQVDRVDPANSIDELYPVLNICPSATYGTVCHIVASYRTGTNTWDDFESAVWLFHIEDIATPKLSPLLTLEVESRPSHVAMSADDTLMVMWDGGIEDRDRPYLKLFNVQGGLKSELSCYLPEYLSRRIIRGNILDRSTVIMLMEPMNGEDQPLVHLVSFEQNAEFCSGHGTLVPHISDGLQIPLRQPSFTSPVYRIHDSRHGLVYVDVNDGPRSVTLRITLSDPPNIGLYTSEFHALPGGLDNLQTFSMPQRVVYLSPEQSETGSKATLRLMVRQLVAREEVERRLGTVARADFSVVINYDDQEPMEAFDIDHDEWTGITVIPWIREHGQLEEMPDASNFMAHYVTVVRV